MATKKLGKLKLSTLTTAPAEETSPQPPEALRPHGSHPGCRTMCSASGRWAAFHWHDQKTEVHWIDDAGAVQTWTRANLVQVELAPDGRRIAASFGRRVLLVDLATRQETTVSISGEVSGMAFTPSGLLAVLTSSGLALVDVDDPDLFPVAVMPVIRPSALVAHAGLLVACADPSIIAGVHGNELRELLVVKKKLRGGRVHADRMYVEKDTWFEVSGAADHAATLDPARPAATYRSGRDPVLTFQAASEADVAACKALRAWSASKEIKDALATSYIERVSLRSELILGSDKNTGRVAWMTSPTAKVVVASQPLKLASIGGEHDGKLLLGEPTALHVADLATGAVRTLAWHPGDADGKQGIVSIAWASGGKIVVQTFERIVLLDAEGSAELGAFRAYWGQGMVTLRGGRYAIASCSGRLEVFEVAETLRPVRSLVDASTLLTVSADDQRFLSEAWQWLELKGL